MNGGNNGVDRDREESRLSPTRSIGRLPKPADWKRRLRRRPSSATVHLFRQTVEVDIESVKSLFMAPIARRAGSIALTVTVYKGKRGPYFYNALLVYQQQSFRRIYQ